MKTCHQMLSLCISYSNLLSLQYRYVTWASWGDKSPATLLFMLTTKEISKVCSPALCERNPLVDSAIKRQWASCQIRKIAGCACAGNAGNVFPRRRLQRKPPVSDPGMHHGTCVTHVPWCMSGSFNCGDGENVPGIPGACAPAILRIWQEAHGATSLSWHHHGWGYDSSDCPITEDKMCVTWLMTWQPSQTSSSIKAAKREWSNHNTFNIFFQVLENHPLTRPQTHDFCEKYNLCLKFAVNA